MELTPLHIAAEVGNLEIVNLLLINGSNVVNEKNKDGCIPIHTAAQYGHTELVKCLIEHGSNLNEQADNMGDTPLHCSMVLKNHNYMNWRFTVDKKLTSIRECDSSDTSFHPQDYVV